MENEQNMTSDRTGLSVKELNYVKDILSWELLAMKKCADAAKACEVQDIKDIINDTGKKHLQHFNQVLSHLNN